MILKKYFFNQSKMRLISDTKLNQICQEIEMEDEELTKLNKIDKLIHIFNDRPSVDLKMSYDNICQTDKSIFKKENKKQVI